MSKKHPFDEWSDNQKTIPERADPWNAALDAYYSGLCQGGNADELARELRYPPKPPTLREAALAVVKYWPAKFKPVKGETPELLALVARLREALEREEESHEG